MVQGNEGQLFVNVKIEDAGDGSGDGILIFPEGLCESLGWKDEQKIEMWVENGQLIIKAID